MEKNEFKDLLFNVLNENGDEEINMVNIETDDRMDTLYITVMDGSQFEIKVQKLK